MKKQIIIFAVLFVSLSITYAQINQTSNCKFTTNDGFNYDFNPLRKLNEDYKYDYMKYSYRANLCGPLLNSCNMSDSPSALFLRTRNICVGKLTSNWSSATAQYIDNDIKTNGLKLTFSGGERCISSYNNVFSLSYTVKCDPNIETTLESVRKVNMCSYDFIFTSKFACPIGSKSSGSSTTILFYIIIAFLLYLSVFTYLNYKENPEDGIIKAFPHKEFWAEFIDSVKVGINLSAEFTRQKIEYYTEKYREYKRGKDVDDF